MDTVILQKKTIVDFLKDATLIEMVSASYIMKNLYFISIKCLVKL